MIYHACAKHATRTGKKVKHIARWDKTVGDINNGTGNRKSAMKYVNDCGPGTMWLTKYG